MCIELLFIGQRLEVGLDREWNDGRRVVCQVLLECFCLDGCGHVAVWLGASELGSRGESCELRELRRSWRDNSWSYGG